MLARLSPSWANIKDQMHGPEVAARKVPGSGPSSCLGYTGALFHESIARPMHLSTDTDLREMPIKVFDQDTI